MLSFLFLLICLTGALPEGFDAGSLCMEANAAEETVTLRVCNWEEYIDLGDWDEEETIELPSGDIIGENSMVEDFEEWYYETYGTRVKVEYSTFFLTGPTKIVITAGEPRLLSGKYLKTARSAVSPGPNMRPDICGVSRVSSITPRP